MTEPYRGEFERPRATTPDKTTADHARSDVDSSPFAQHHTIGPRKDQAAGGAHRHDGSDSSLILTGTTITGAKAGNTAVASVIAALVKLGATDSTT